MKIPTHPATQPRDAGAAGLERRRAPLSLYDLAGASGTVRHLAWAVTLLALAALATGLRLNAGDLINFSRDDSWLLLFGRHWIEGGPIPLVGIGSSQGVQNGALTVYLTALPLWLGGGAGGALAVVAILHGLAAAGAAWLGGRYFGRPAGIGAALLFALQPWSIVYGRSLALAGFLPPFTVAYVAFLYLFAVETRRWALPLAGLAAGLLPQIHLGGIWLWPLLLVVMLSRPRQLSVWLLGLTAFLGALPFVPWLVWNAQQGWSDVLRLRAYAGEPARVTADAWRLLWDMSGSQGYGGTLGGAFERFVSRGGLAPDALDLLLQAALGLGVATCLVGVCRPAAWPAAGPRAPGWRGYLLALAWLVCVPLALTRHAQPIYPHYVFLAFPAPQVIAGIGFWLPAAWLARRLRLPRWLPAAGLAGLLLLIAGFQARSYQAFLGTYAAAETPGGFGTPLGRQSAALDRVFATAAGQPVFLASDEDRPGIGGDATNWEFLRDNRPAKLVAAPQYLVYPLDRPAVYLVSPTVPADSPLPGLRGVGEALHGYRILESPPGRDILASLNLNAGHYEAATPALRLIGQSVERPWRAGDVQRVSVWWEPAGPRSAPYDLQMSLQLFDPAGRRVAQQDRLGYPATNWEVGELVVSFFDLPIPAEARPGAYRLRTVLYRAETGIPLEWRDPTGQSAGPALETTIDIVPTP